ncbi:MAG: hypothetical protein ABSD53_17570 [Terriglobales bacterium]|jgi:hypothetical protein
MRLEGIVYPDVYCLAFMLSDDVEFLAEGEEVAAGKYDLILAELQGSETQLRYLEKLVRARNSAVAVIPGPPEILSRDLTHDKLRMVKHILRAAAQVWAYSPELKVFCDGLVGSERAIVIPWPYDLSLTQRLGRCDESRLPDRYSVFVQLPLRFHDVTQNHPFVLKSVLLDVWDTLPSAVRDRLCFHTCVYTEQDRQQYYSSGFADGLPFVLEPRRSYRSFLRFLGQCQGVVNLTTGSILGRVTFLSAALGCAGIFSKNSEFNRRIYSDACVDLFDIVRLRELLDRMFSGIAKGVTDNTLLPSCEALAEVGDFRENQRRLRVICERISGRDDRSHDRRPEVSPETFRISETSNNA